MTQRTTMFGYGSLMNQEGLLGVAPGTQDIRPAKIRGYRRILDTPSNYRKEADGSSIAVLTIVADADAWMNGITFSVAESDMPEIRTREAQYDFVETEAEPYDGGDPYKALVLQVRDPKPFPFRYESAVQMEYLKECLSGAETIGEGFLRDFRDTTFIDGKSLTERGL